MLTEHSAIVLPVIFRKSGLPPAVEVKRRRVMSDANLSLLLFWSPVPIFTSLLSFYPAATTKFPLPKDSEEKLKSLKIFIYLF